MNKTILLIIIIVLSILGIMATIMINPSIEFNKLNIYEEEWNNIISARSEGNIEFKDIKFNECDLIIDNENNKIYYSVIKNNSNKFSPLVKYKSSSYGAKMAVLDDVITEDKIMNNHEFKVLLYDEDSYRVYGLYCTSFPMLNIVYDEKTSKSSINIPMSLYLFNNFDNGINRIVKSDGKFDIVEMENDTYNYKFSLVMTTPGNNERDNVISLLHMKPSNEYFLNAINVGENTSPLIPEKRKQREEKPNDINNMSGDVKVKNKEKNEQMVELFINNTYIGLYSLNYNPDIKIKPRNG